MYSIYHKAHFSCFSNFCIFILFTNIFVAYLFSTKSFNICKTDWSKPKRQPADGTPVCATSETESLIDVYIYARCSGRSHLFLLHICLLPSMVHNPLLPPHISLHGHNQLLFSCYCCCCCCCWCCLFLQMK